MKFSKYFMLASSLVLLTACSAQKQETSAEPPTSQSSQEEQEVVLEATPVVHSDLSVLKTINVAELTTDTGEAYQAPDWVKEHVGKFYYKKEYGHPHDFQHHFIAIHNDGVYEKITISDRKTLYGSTYGSDSYPYPYFDNNNTYQSTSFEIYGEQVAFNELRYEQGVLVEGFGDIYLNPLYEREGVRGESTYPLGEMNMNMDVYVTQDGQIDLTMTDLIWGKLPVNLALANKYAELDKVLPAISSKNTAISTLLKADDAKSEFPEPIERFLLDERPDLETYESTNPFRNFEENANDVLHKAFFYRDIARNFQGEDVADPLGVFETTTEPVYDSSGKELDVTVAIFINYLDDDGKQAFRRGIALIGGELKYFNEKMASLLLKTNTKKARYHLAFLAL